MVSHVKDLPVRIMTLCRTAKIMKKAGEVRWESRIILTNQIDMAFLLILANHLQSPKPSPCQSNCTTREHVAQDPRMTRQGILNTITVHHLLWHFMQIQGGTVHGTKPLNSTYQTRKALQMLQELLPSRILTSKAEEENAMQNGMHWMRWFWWCSWWAFFFWPCDSLSQTVAEFFSSTELRFWHRLCLGTNMERDLCTTAFKCSNSSWARHRNAVPATLVIPTKPSWVWWIESTTHWLRHAKTEVQTNIIFNQLTFQ